VKWKLCTNAGEVLQSGEQELSVKALSYASLDEMDFQKTDTRKNYLSFAFLVDGKEVSFGTVLFTKPKHYQFVDPKLSLEVQGDEIIVHSSAFAKYVYICNKNDDLILSDNFFDMEKGTKTLRILSGDVSDLTVVSVYDIR